MDWKIVVLVLALVVMISGCEGLSDFTNILQMNKQVTKVGVRDVLTIKDVTVDPSSVVLAGEDVSLRFIIENVDTQKEAMNTYVELYDDSFLKCGDSNDDKSVTAADMITVGSTAYCRSYHNVCSNDHTCTILPLGQQQVFFNLKSPTEKEIANIASSTQLSFRVLYSFNGGTKTDLVVANLAELERAQRTGKTMQASSSKSYDSGPIEIEAELLNRDFAISGQTATMRFQITDKGSSGGSIKDAVVAPGKFVIDFTDLGFVTVIPAGTQTSDVDYGTDSGDSRRTDGSDTSSGSGDDSRRATVSNSENSDDLSKIFSDVISAAITGLVGDDSRRIDTGTPGSDSGLGTTDTGVIVGQSSAIFNCGRDATRNKITCINLEPLTIMNGKSSPYIFKLSDLPSVEIFKTFNIIATINYEYELRDSARIQVKPYEQ